MVKDGARFPIVTLEGEVFAPSGTVSGGRMRQNAGAIGRNRQMAEAEERIGELERRIALVETRLKAGEDEERRLAAERDEAAAAATLIVRAAARRARRNVMSVPSLRICPLTLQPASATHLRRYAAGGA